jgi:transposase InsO family protein
MENVSEKSQPLRELIHKDTEWSWTEVHQKAFDELKNGIMSPPVLQYYDPKKPVRLTCDASKSGLGAAILQEGMPVAYASKSMTKAQMNYAQIEKEMLAVLFACKRFDQYVYGRRFTVETDHQPLITICKKPMHAAPMRLQKMLMCLQRYSFDIVYKRGKELYIADTLSRSYTESDDETIGEDRYEVMAAEPVSDARYHEIERAANSDDIYQEIVKTIKNGWPKNTCNVKTEIESFFPVRDELTVQDGLIWKSDRIVIPTVLRDEYIKKLHLGHPGIEATKRRARETVYWPTIMEDIVQFVQACSTCNACRNHQGKEKLMPHPIPEFPWQRVSMDICEFDNSQYLIVVDSYSGWYEPLLLADMKTKTIIKKLKCLFATHGSPNILMSDNARNFVSAEFKKFASEWNIELINSSPTYAQSNGLAERSVQSFKTLMRKCKRDETDFYLALLNMRNVPRNENLGSPAQRLMSRRTRTTLPATKKQLAPKVIGKVKQNLKKVRENQRKNYDKTGKTLRNLKPDEIVRIQTEKGYDRIAKVVSNKGPRSYLIQEGEKTYVRNRVHLLPVKEKIKEEKEDVIMPAETNKDSQDSANKTTAEPPHVPPPQATPPRATTPRAATPRAATPRATPPRATPPRATPPQEMPPRITKACESAPPPQATITRSGRISKPPVHKDFVQY